jgi:hypothetical protein
MKNFHSARFFFLVFIHIATILVSSLCLKIDNENLGLQNFIPSIPQLLKGVSDCDIRILWDGLQEFEFDSKHQWPTTIIFVPHYSDKSFYDDYFHLNAENATFAFNIIQTRIQFCVINLLFIGNQSVLQSPTHDFKNDFIIQQPSVSISLYFSIAYSTYLYNKREWGMDKFTQFLSQNPKIY